MRRRTKGLAAAASLAVAASGAVAAVAASSADETDELAAAKAATAHYRDVDDAEDDGWVLPPEGPLHECIEPIDGPGSMGLHYINSTNVGDTMLDPESPAALVYEPTADGDLRLVAAEYVVFAEAWHAEHPDEHPELFGRELMYVAEPNRYELPAFYQIHAWMWKDNPAGIHADFNVDVSCGTSSGATAKGTSSSIGSY